MAGPHGFGTARSRLLTMRVFEAAPHRLFSAVTATLTVPLASTIRRSVLEQLSRRTTTSCGIVIDIGSVGAEGAVMSHG